MNIEDIDNIREMVDTLEIYATMQPINGREDFEPYKKKKIDTALGELIMYLISFTDDLPF